ncbi:ribonuclease G [Vaginisenegalia massiliensis]|uniref:ribonuclease G n=1 Tax=Vaginisenegalia massiliensis TaxID=2058294 RepID=UPI000F52E75F|nr:ribonuclease G [Vaginisenegalia massiliensis]
MPDEIKGWNWGAFIYNIWWGIGNKTYLPLLCLIPLFNIIWIFVCGAKGNEWAWRDGQYTDVETFKKVQATWNRAGFIQFLVFLAVLVLYFLIFSVFFNELMHYSSNSY